MSELATIDNDIQEWHRIPKESAQAFAAFNLYRNLLPPRTIRAAAELHAETVPRKGKSVGTVYTMFKAWAVKWDWKERADAFDIWLDSRRIEARETERARIDREQMLEGRYLRSAAISRFTGGRDAQGQPILPIDWNDLDADQAMAAYKLGRDTERQAAGLQVGATLGMMPVAHAREIAEDIFNAAMDFIPDERKQAFVQRVHARGQGR